MRAEQRGGGLRQRESDTRPYAERTLTVTTKLERFTLMARESLAQTLGVEQQPHQGGEPRLRLFARHPCETLKFSGHGQSPLGDKTDAKRLESMG